MPSIETYRLLITAADACDAKKAEDIRILALDPNESSLTDYFVICNGTSDRQNVAISDEVEIRLKRDFGIYPNSVEGRRQGEWILLDYVDFIVHVFSAEKRSFYGLEKLRKSAVTVNVAQLDDELKNALRTRPKSIGKRAYAKCEPKTGTQDQRKGTKKGTTEVTGAHDISSEEQELAPPKLRVNPAKKKKPKIEAARR